MRGGSEGRFREEAARRGCVKLREKVGRWNQVRDGKKSEGEGREDKGE